MAFGGGHFALGHLEGEGVDAEEGLAVVEGGFAEEVDFFDFGIGHGGAADGEFVAVNHDEGASAAVGAVVGIGVADVEGEVVARVWVELVFGDEVESFGGLAVAFFEFGAEGAGHAGDRVGAEEFEVFFVGLLQPKFEFTFLFEDADEDGVAEAESGFR